MQTPPIELAIRIDMSQSIRPASDLPWPSTYRAALRGHLGPMGQNPLKKGYESDAENVANSGAVQHFVGVGVFEQLGMDVDKMGQVGNEVLRDLPRRLFLDEQVELVGCLGHCSPPSLNCLSRHALDLEPRHCPKKCRGGLAFSHCRRSGSISRHGHGRWFAGSRARAGRPQRRHHTSASPHSQMGRPLVDKRSAVLAEGDKRMQPLSSFPSRKTSRISASEPNSFG